jgi:hypothetical protein
MIKEIVQNAQQAAKQAETEFLAKHGEPMYCGFGWVEVYVDRTNSKEARELIAAGFKKSYKPKCLSLWTVGDYNGQSMDVKEAGAGAFARVLQQAGLRAYACSRAD